MMRRWIALAGFASGSLSVFGSCMIYDNGDTNETRQCVARATVGDGKACHCDTDCTSIDHGGYCLDESIGFARGFCFHECSRDRDCGEGLACVVNRCAPKCSATYDCDRGRRCTSSGRTGIAGCLAFCDESTDCESGRCNPYSGWCLAPGEKVRGAGLNAECKNDEDCRSENCIDGTCMTRCDPLFQRCPDDAFCNEHGWCVDPSDAALSCDADAGMADEDGGPMCDAGAPTE